MSAAFDRAAITKPFRVLGRSLRPFSLGHEMLLSASGNAFANSAKDRAPGFSDVALAVRLCRQDYASAIADVLSGNIKFRVWLFYLQHVPFSAELEILKFRAYLHHYRSGPEFTRKGDVSRSAVGSPFEYTLKVFLCTKMGLTPSQALNYPYCTAVADYLTYLEMKGALHIVDSIEELQQEARRVHDEIMAKINGG